MLKTQIVFEPFEQADADVLAVLEYERESGDAAGAAKIVDALTGGWLAEIRSSKEFTGGTLETAVLHRPVGLKAGRLLVAGAGKPEKFDTAQLRKLAGALVRGLKSKNARRVALVLDGSAAGPEFVAAAVEGAILGDFEPNQHITDPKKTDKAVDSFTVIVPGGDAGLQAAFDAGRSIGESQNFARELVNEPGNLLTPTVLAEKARAMAAESGLECEVLDQDRMRQLGMGSLLGVSMGSAEPPALIVLRYKPAAAPAGADHLGLVGKGVTFDTGGISIKPADGMEKMKYDMGGGAAVIGAMRALAALKPAIPVTALIPAVENMPGSKALRPGDILTALSGKTIEVLNTDAEGRLILADALTYAQRIGCTHLVDAATLTGAIGIALGTVRAGAFTNNDGFLEKLLNSSKAEGERMWHMPLDEDYKEQLKSAFADLQNIGGRSGGAITAAWFLREFVGETPWVHLDIASMAWLDEAKPHLAKGPTGFPVRTFVHLAMNWG
jgi:leucyl aminopeptidase